MNETKINSLLLNLVDILRKMFFEICAFKCTENKCFNLSLMNYLYILIKLEVVKKQKLGFKFVKKKSKQ